MREVNKSLQFEVDDLKQKLKDSNGDIKVLLVFIYAFMLMFCKLTYISLISPPKNDSFRKDLCFSPDVFLKLFLSTRDLREAWADRREILHDGQY